MKCVQLDINLYLVWSSFTRICELLWKDFCRRADDWPFVRNKEALGVPGSPQVGKIIDIHHPYRCQKLFLDHLWQVYVYFQSFFVDIMKTCCFFITPHHFDIFSYVTSFFLAESAPSLESFLFAGWQVLDQFDLRPINFTTWGSTPILKVVVHLNEFQLQLTNMKKVTNIENGCQNHFIQA